MAAGMRHHDHHCARLLRLLVAMVGLLATVAVVAPATSWGHARLRSSDPAADASVDTAPGQIMLQFSGSVSTHAGSVQVFGPGGDRVDRGAPSPSSGAMISQPTQITQDGTYGVAYRVSSEDGHVITGSYSFTVTKPGSGSGSPSGTGPGTRDVAAAAKEAASVDRGVQTAFSLARFVELLSLLLVAGGGIFACLVARGRRPALLLPALVLLLAAQAAGVVLNTAIVDGVAPGRVLSTVVLGDLWHSPFGASMRIRGVVALIAIGPTLLLTFGQRSLAPGTRWTLAAVFAALAASAALTGHAVTTNPLPIRLSFDMVHLIAAAVWVGGLLQLGCIGPAAVERMDDVVRFSRTAFVCVVVLLVTGVVNTLIELGPSAHGLVGSTYGRLLLAKLALYVGTMPLAWNNMTAFVPAISRRPEDAAGMLRQYVWRELALLVAVIGLTVWLIATPPPLAA